MIKISRKLTGIEVISMWIKEGGINKESLQMNSYKDLFDLYIDWINKLDKAHKNHISGVSKPTFTKDLKKYLQLKNIERLADIKRIKTKQELFQIEKYKKFKQNVTEKFDQIKAYTRLAARFYKPVCVVTGDSGIGKSHTVRETLDIDEEKFTFISGIIKGAFSLYEVLYENKDKLILFDDADDFLKDTGCINMLKAALDSYTGKIISYRGPEIYRPINKKKKLPTSFNYDGTVIFISNLYKFQVHRALVNRSLFLEFDLEPEEIFERMKDKLQNFYPKVSMKEKKTVLDFLYNNQEIFEKPSFRMLEDGILLMEADKSVEGENWQKWLFNSIAQGRKR